MRHAAHQELIDTVNLCSKTWRRDLHLLHDGTHSAPPLSGCLNCLNVLGHIIRPELTRHAVLLMLHVFIICSSELAFRPLVVD